MARTGETGTPDPDRVTTDESATAEPTQASETASARGDGRTVESVSAHLTVVGIGASAGGLNALRTFLKAVSPDSGLAYVIVVHLSREHKSHLVELLRPSSSIPIQQVTQTVALEPNNAYVIPPNANLSAVDTHLRLSELEERPLERAPIDHFFRTLSNIHDGHAVGVVLTGTGSDGTLGVKEIKAKGGLAVVQDPNEAEYDGMPQSALATGLIDLVLPVEGMPDAIARIARTRPRVPRATDEEALAEEERRSLQKVFAQLRERIGRDFTRYRRATVLRRIARRMQIVQVEELPDYLQLLRDSPDEVRALADDLLITVTSFFRDPEVFEAVERDVIPKLFDAKSGQDEVRVWSVGCATGEEAYTLAILLLEEAGRREDPPKVQVFASDLHDESLQRARDGFYAGDIESELTPARLRRFFQRENGGYRVRKEVRESVIFAPHNLLSDPPFSRLDLVSCRNLLIYLQRDIQRDVIELFHYALRPEGFLVLGTAETLESHDLFRMKDKQHCLYVRRNVPAPEPRRPVFPLSRSMRPGERRARERPPEPVAYRSLHQRMVDLYGPPSALVSADDKVVHLSQRAGRYLVHPGGELTASIYKLVRDELRIELRSALHTAREMGQVYRTKPIAVRLDGYDAQVVIDARVAPEREAEGFALVQFEELAPRGPAEASGDERAEPSELADAHVLALESELDTSRQRLQEIIEEYETSQEEMKASNEELQSANEELQSTVEELETSKEELRSMNEELQTVNQENRHKVEELAQLTSDLQNLLAATDIATLFLDRDLRIMRFTPKVGELFNIRGTDRGRPLSDITHRLAYDGLGDDAARVLRTLVPVEGEVRDDDDRWYIARTRPYCSTDDRIEGVVITLIDITDRKRMELELQRSEEFHRRAVEAAHVGTWDLALASGDTSISAQMAVLLGVGRGPTAVSQAQMLELVHPEDRPVWETAVAAATEGDSGLELELRIVREGRVRWIYSKGGLSIEDGSPHIHGASIDVTALNEAGAALRSSERQYRTLFESIQEGFGVMEVQLDPAGRAVDARWLETNPAFEVHTGILGGFGKGAQELVPGQKDRWMETYGRIALTGRPEQFVEESPALGRWFEIDAFRVGEPEARRVGLLLRDITERRRSEEELRRVNETLEKQEERFRRLVESAAQLTWSADTDGNVTADTALWREFTGQSRDEGSKGRWLKMFHADDRAELVRSWTFAVGEESPFEHEARIFHAPSNAYRWVAIRAVPLPAETGKVRGWFGMGLDVDELKRAEERIRSMAGKLTAAERHERHRIAQLLHDDLQQVLYSVQMKLSLAREAQNDVVDPEALLAQVDWSLNMLEDAIAKTRNLTVDLSPPLLAGEGIVGALRWLRTPMRDLHHLDVDIGGDPEAGVASEDVANLLFQVVRELLFNVAKHGETDRAEVDVELVDELIRGTVADHGIGFDMDAVRMQHDDEAAFGLLSARERLRLRGGDLEIASAPGRGTRVVVYLPVSSGS